MATDGLSGINSNVSQLAQALASWFQGLCCTRGGRSIAQEADPGHLPPLLRVSGIRRREQAQDERDDAPDGMESHRSLPGSTRSGWDASVEGAGGHVNTVACHPPWCR